MTCSSPIISKSLQCSRMYIIFLYVNASFLQYFTVFPAIFCCLDTYNLKFIYIFLLCVFMIHSIHYKSSFFHDDLLVTCNVCVKILLLSSFHLLLLHCHVSQNRHFATDAAPTCTKKHHSSPIMVECVTTRQSGHIIFVFSDCIGMNDSYCLILFSFMFW